MTNVPVEQPVRLRVVLALAAGLLAEVFTIAVVAIVYFGHKLMTGAETREQTNAFMMRAGGIVGPLFGVIFTFVMALWVVRKAKGRYMAHGLLVGVGAAAIHVVTSIGTPGGYRMIHAIADVLKLVAGAAAAMLATRRDAGRAAA